MLLTGGRHYCAIITDTGRPLAFHRSCDKVRSSIGGRVGAPWLWFGSFGLSRRIVASLPIAGRHVRSKHFSPAAKPLIFDWTPLERRWRCHDASRLCVRPIVFTSSTLGCLCATHILQCTRCVAAKQKGVCCWCKQCPGYSR